MPASTVPFESVCIGASHGGFDVLLDALPQLPADFALPILVCLHLPAGSGHDVASHLNRRSAIRVVEAQDKFQVRPGYAYVAPGGYHLLVERDASLSLSADPPVLHARPSIDVLFDSAALAWGNRLIAVLMTGASRDGAAGIETAGRCGATTVVQDPTTAVASVMPQAALDTIQPDHLVEPQALAATLIELAQRERPTPRSRDATHG